MNMNAVTARKMFDNWLDHEVVCKELPNGEIYIGLDTSSVPAGRVIKSGRLEEVSSPEELDRNSIRMLFYGFIMLIVVLLFMWLATP